MSRSSKEYRELQVLKKELQRDVSRLEQTYIKRAERTAGKVKRTLQPIQSIKKDPVKAVAVSVAVGFLLGFTRSGRKKRREPSSTTGTTRYGFSSMLFDELKRLAAHKAMIYVSDLVDREVMSRIDKGNNSR
ncbi:MAG: hypothetical protein ACNA78_07085 [Balneolaceae bacterium]